MKKVVFLTSTILLWAGMAVAQDASANPANQTSSSASQTLQGCLSKSGDNYNLNANGQEYKVTGGDLSQLSGKDGHTVSINGTVSGSEISLQSASDVASTCSNTSASNSGTSSSDSSNTAAATGAAAGAGTAGAATTAANQTADNATSAANQTA